MTELSGVCRKVALSEFNFCTKLRVRERSVTEVPISTQVRQNYITKRGGETRSSPGGFFNGTEIVKCNKVTGGQVEEV